MFGVQNVLYQVTSDREHKVAHTCLNIRVPGFLNLVSTLRLSNSWNYLWKLEWEAFLLLNL